MGEVLYRYTPVFAFVKQAYIAFVHKIPGLSSHAESCTAQGVSFTSQTVWGWSRCRSMGGYITWLRSEPGSKWVIGEFQLSL